MTKLRAAILGGGPIGVEAALAFAQSGYDVALFERGEIGSSVLEWGHVTLFSPWALNVSERGVSALRAAGVELPDGETFSSGRAYVETYLKPLSQAPALEGCIHTGTNVVGVGRDGVLKGQMIGSPERTQHRFRLVVEDADSVERVEEADIVLDATGTYGNHRFLGSSGIPALGERQADAAGRITYDMSDVTGDHRDQFAGKHVAVIGAGYSAATSLAGLASLAAADSATRVTWLTSQTGAPYERVENDPLPQRDALAARANRIAAGEMPWASHTGGIQMDGLATDADGTLTLSFRTKNGPQTISGVDHVIANVGFHPDTSVTRELQMHHCWASEGPMKLAAALLSQDGGGSGDCLAQGSLGPETLRNPEKNFFVLGAKSYGRRSDFLIKLGITQIDEVLGLLE